MYIIYIVGVLLQPPIPIFHFLQETVNTVFFVCKHVSLEVLMA